MVLLGSWGGGGGRGSGRPCFQNCCIGEGSTPVSNGVEKRYPVPILPVKNGAPSTYLITVSLLEILCFYVAFNKLKWHSHTLMGKRLNFSVYNVALAITLCRCPLWGRGWGVEGGERERGYSPSMRPWIFSQFNFMKAEKERGIFNL